MKQQIIYHSSLTLEPKIFYNPGTPIEESKKYTAEIAQILQNENEVLHTFSSIGYDSKDPFTLLKEEIGVTEFIISWVKTLISFCHDSSS